MEHFGARDEQPMAECMRLVRSESDIFVGVYAHRYGFIPEGQSTSICEMEYRAASEVGLPRFIYLVDDDHLWSPKHIDRDPADIQRLGDFKTLLLRRHICQTFGGEDNLARKVAADLGRYLAMQAIARIGVDRRIDQKDQGFESREYASIAGIGLESMPEGNVPIADHGHPNNVVRRAIYARNRDIFLAHVIRPSTKPGQKFDVFIYLVRHQYDQFSDVQRADFFLGPYWNNEIFSAYQKNGFIGIATSAYGTFLCTCRVLFGDGYSVELERYIDFEALRTDGQSA